MVFAFRILRIRTEAFINDATKAGTAANRIRSLMQSVEVELCRAENIDLDPARRLDAACRTMNLLDEAAVDAARLLRALGFDGGR